MKWAQGTFVQVKDPLMLVGDTGIEPVTSSVSGKRSPAELIALDVLNRRRANHCCDTREVETGFEPV
jgi:hypothetical protein